MKVALFGTGLMGFPMAGRLLKAGYELTVFNRTREKASPLREAGARVAESPHQAMAEADLIILMLSDAAAISGVLFGGNDANLAGKTVLQMGTIAPAESRDFLKRVVERGGAYLECPVLGSRREATDGQLILMAGASPEQFRQWEPVLKCFGPEPRLIGPVGAAATLKLAMNQLIASLACSFSASLGLVEAGGIDVETFMGLLRKSALYAPAFDKKLPLILAHDYGDANFPAKHLLKDVRLFLAAAGEHRLSADHLEGVEHIIEKTIALGRGGEDYISLFEAIYPGGK